MKKVSMKEFYEKQAEFIRKHPISKVDTTPMVDNSYRKHYIAEDGAEMWESNRIITHRAEVEAYGIKCVVDVKLWETECWSTDEASSMYLYQQA